MMPTKKLKLAMNNAMDRREVLEGMKTRRSKLFICTFFSILGSRSLPRLHSMWLVARKSWWQQYYQVDQQLYTTSFRVFTCFLCSKLECFCPNLEWFLLLKGAWFGNPCAWWSSLGVVPNYSGKINCSVLIPYLPPLFDKKLNLPTWK
jgi:hypothetical protein